MTTDEHRLMLQLLFKQRQAILTSDCEDTDRNQVDDEFCHGRSDNLRRRCRRQERQWDARHAIGEFSKFAKREDSSMLQAMEALAAVGTSGAAAELLGKTKVDFCRMRSRLRQVGQVLPDG
jgi:hypothetical protein